MKIKFGISSIVIAALCGALQSMAQTNMDYTTSRDRDTRERDVLPGGHYQLGKLEKANEIIGREIKDSQEQKLGKVKDLAVDLQNGRIVEVIVATGGMMGIDEQLVAVPPGKFSCDADLKTLQLNIDRAQLKSAPSFKMAEWDSNVSEAYVTGVYQYYNTQPYFGDTAANGSTLNRAQNTVSIAMSPHDAASRSNNPAVSGLSGTSNSLATGTIRHLGEVERASKLIGTITRNLQDEKLGKVENLVVDLPAGRIVEVVLATGGFLGMGGELSAVPPQSFRQGTERDTLLLDTTKAALSQAPHFKPADWSSANSPDQISSVYRSYHVEAEWTTNAVDNTAQNVRDRQDNALTPLDQGNSPVDLDITKQIRQQVMAINGLSVDAQNVKIITVNGRVTLRGPVNSEEEKRQISDIAARVAPGANIDNQLQVKTSNEPTQQPPSVNNQ